MGVLLYICCMFSKHLFLRTHLEGSFRFFLLCGEILLKVHRVFPYFWYQHYVYLQQYLTSQRMNIRSSPPEVFLGKGILRICSIFTGEHPCLSVISIKLLRNFIEITLQHGSYLVKSLQIFRTSFSKNTSGGLLLILNINFKDQVKMCTLNRKLHLRNKKYEWEHEYQLVVRCDLHKSNLYLIRR